MGNKVLSKEFIKQFFSYFCVGGIAALVEWGMYFLFDSILHFHYILATVLAFVFSTTVNWFLGRVMTFRNSKKYTGKAAKEISLIFIVSAIGLLLNMVLMWLFIDGLHLDTGSLKLVSKIMATGLVFIWNFLIRKLVIYKEHDKTGG